MGGVIIVCFTGIDGSGKTLHALTLMQEMRKKGISCRYTWCRWSFGLSSFFHFIVRKTLGYTKENFACLKPLQVIFQHLFFLDFIFNVFIKVRVPKALGFCVIIDRYVFDVLADMRFWGFDISVKKTFVRLMFSMNPKPSITFLIDVPPKVALSRKRDLSLVDAIKYSRIYNNWAKVYHLQKVVNLDFHKAHNQILDEVLEINNKNEVA